MGWVFATPYHFNVMILAGILSKRGMHLGFISHLIVFLAAKRKITSPNILMY